MSYVIRDWTGKICFGGIMFDDFEDAWGFIEEQIESLVEHHTDEDQREKEFNDWCGEFYVEEIETIK